MDGFGGTPIFGNLHPSSARILLEWSNAPEGRFGWRMLGCRGLLPRRISRMGWEWLRNLIQKYQTCPGSSGPSIFLEHIPILKFGDTWPSIPVLSIVLLCHALSPPKSQRHTAAMVAMGTEEKKLPSANPVSYIQDMTSDLELRFKLWHALELDHTIIMSSAGKMSMIGKQNKGLTCQTRWRPYGKVVNCHDYIEITPATLPTVTPHFQIMLNSNIRWTGGRAT